MSKFANFLTKAFHWLFLILITFLFVSSLFVTGIHQKLEKGIDEFVIIENNNLLISLAILVGGVALVVGFYKLADVITTKRNINMKIVCAVVCTLAFGLAVTWINILKVVPGADQDFCVQYAIAMNNGDFTCLEQSQYLANYPHLLGTIAFLRLLFKLFGEGNYDAFRYFNAICIPVMIYAGFRIVGKFTQDDKKTELFYLMAMLFCIPAYAYVLYIYGDLAGPAWGILAFWFFYQCLDRLSAKNILGLVLSTMVSVGIRKNMLIFTIAMVVVVIVRLFKKISKQDFILLGTLIATIIISIYYVNLFYLPHKVDLDHAVPATACIAMGFNDDKGYAGWYNYYELVVMAENDWEPEAASAEAMNVIKGVYVPLFLHNPKYTADFFFRKISSQWQVPLYQSIVSNILLYGPQNDFVMSVYFGTWNEIFQWFMKMYQVMMYGFIMALLWMKRKDNTPIEYYALLIAVFGGFLLSLVWESKARYIYPYFIIMIPMYAIAVQKLMHGDVSNASK